MQGFVDSITPQSVAGWAFDAEGNNPAKITVLQRGQIVGHGLANLFRPDLTPVAVGACCAFLIPLALESTDDVKVVANDAYELRASTALEKCPPLSTPLPSADLIFLVNGHRSREHFEDSRRVVVRNMTALLNEAGIDWHDFRAILDFGCGCGRILAGWEHYISHDVKLYGVDINPELVAFCRDNIPFSSVQQCSQHPPLPFRDAQFDFIYAASVWTHLKLQASQAWALEAKRLLARGGVLMMSYSGDYYAPQLAKLSAEGCRVRNDTGFYVYVHGSEAHTFEGANTYATFMTSDFVRNLFEGLELLCTFSGTSRGPNAFASYQDIAVFKQT